MAGERKIHKVPVQLRQDEHNNDAYDPKVVSFGPYHHGKKELQLCQEAKHWSVQKLVDGSGKDYNFFYQKIMEKIADARNCYIEDPKDKCLDVEFAKMMLYDACFLIYCMKIDDRKPGYFDLMISQCTNPLIFSLVNRDIFLLENQLPFSIVMLLINLRYGSEGEETVNMFLHESIWGQYEPNTAESTAAYSFKQEPSPLHLLEAVHRVLVFDQTLKNPSKEDKSSSKEDNNRDVNVKEYYKNFRSAKDLKARGIRFKPSPNKSLKDISFIPGMFYGDLLLPTWMVTPLSKVFFTNMIAYELCNNNVDMTVISYLNFMKLLIESPVDVKELREKNILLMSLGSDEQVVKLFNELNTYGVAFEDKLIKRVKVRVQERYDDRGRTWMAQMIHMYFSTPWSIVAWIAALLLFLLTIIQTYYTIIG